MQREPTSKSVGLYVEGEQGFRTCTFWLPPSSKSVEDAEFIHSEGSSKCISIVITKIIVVYILLLGISNFVYIYVTIILFCRLGQESLLIT